MTSAQAAKSLIRAYTSYPKIGEVYLGTVVRLVDFGSFVEIKAGVEGMCHISQLDENKVEQITDLVKEGDEILVKIIAIDKQGRIKLSRKEALGQKPTFYARPL